MNDPPTLSWPLPAIPPTRCAQSGELVIFPHFPAAGDLLAGCRIVAELGRGALGRVYLASQPDLAERPLVLKVTPCRGHEHLSLARLQHTHIVPLYFAHEERGLRVLAMPYFGGASLARVLELLRPKPVRNRTGADLLSALDRACEGSTFPRSPARAFLARASYVQALCWLTSCLAEGLHYAHERGLVHLDVKPANVLLTAEGQPMLLDFHLAHEPIGTDGPSQCPGGTLVYMAPEQQAAMLARERRQPTPQPVDGRADVYALGVMLYEALGGTLPYLPRSSPPLRACNPQVSPGLNDLVHRCLAHDLAVRYPGAAAVAADLKRHLGDLPLRGVANRSLAERWAKWRRRRPFHLSLIALVVAVVITATVGVGTVLERFVQQREQARAALAEGRQLLEQARPAEAEQALRRGLDTARQTPGCADLDAELTAVLRQAEEARTHAERLQLIRELRRLADRVRFVVAAESLPPARLAALEASCLTLLERRDRLLPLTGEPSVREDVLDLTACWAELHGRLAAPDRARAARAEAERVLADVETLIGKGRPQETAWEHCRRGRTMLRDGDLESAEQHLRQAVRLEPGGLWPNFYLGLCAAGRGHPDDAARAFSVCLGVRPDSAVLFVHRAAALEALRCPDQALADYDRALELEPALAAAWLRRGLLHLEQDRPHQAVGDLRRALDNGSEPAATWFHLARAHLAEGDRPAAAARLRQVLAQAPDHAEARALLAQVGETR